MLLTRRIWLGAAAATGALAASAVAFPNAAMPVSITTPQGGRSRHDYSKALDALSAYAQAELKAIGQPGMTLCVVDTDGFVALMTFGWADIDRRIPVSTNHFFQIGSISKSFAAMTIFHLADAGKIDLDSPLAKYLPDAMLPEEPITVAQVLSHTSGLADGPPLFPRVPGGRLWCGFKPGSHFSYSNTGYELLGHLIGRVTGKPHPEAIRDMVMTPLGMKTTSPVITNEDRTKYAVGYGAFYQDRPTLTQAPLAVAPWTDEDFASGSVASTAEQMANYLRCLLTLGVGKGAPIMSDRSAQRFVKPVTDAAIFGPKAKYGNGVATVLIDGKPALHHTGGMICYTSSFHADPVAGVACFASVNGSIGDYRPRLTTSYAVRLMRAVKAGAHLPPPPDPVASVTVKNPGDFTGIFVASSGGKFDIALRNGQLMLVDPDATGRLQLAGKDTLMTDHPGWAMHLFTAVREHGKVGALWWGNHLLGRNARRAQPAVPPRIQAMSGIYLNRDPWVGQTNVLAQGAALVVEGLGPLTETKDGWWKSSEPADPERYMFDGELDSVMTRLNMSGNDMLRVF